LEQLDAKDFNHVYTTNLMHLSNNQVQSITTNVLYAVAQKSSP
jgi:hypothetical protein